MPVSVSLKIGYNVFLCVVVVFAVSVDIWGWVACEIAASILQISYLHALVYLLLEWHLSTDDMMEKLCNFIFRGIF